MMASQINQKEYLKKYLSIGKNSSKKKKKKDKQKVEARVKIIDDDIDEVNHIKSVEEAEELLGGSEDAPQIVGVIDDRPLSLRIDDYRKSDLWKPIGHNSLDEVIKPENEVKQISFNFGKGSNDTGKKHTSKVSGDKNRQKTISKNNDQDLSPPRSIRRKPSRFDSDSSVPKANTTPMKDTDLSPPRVRKQNDDLSPVRVKRRRDSDSSPKRSVSSLSQKTNENKDLSPPRATRNEDCSPPRKRIYHESIDEPGVKKNKYVIPQKRIINDKMSKTLEGKKAGLQSAQELVKENKEFKMREDKLFQGMNEEVSGKNATAIVRDRKTGKIRDLDKEAQVQKEKEEKEAKNKEKYMKWGKGLKQVEDHNEKLAQDLHEMNKPLARYADDEDLEKYLRDQEREGDPMLSYLRKKKKKKDVQLGLPEKPTYQGEFMPNRFGIRPGHRWDGVDRSNGYEKKWFETQNSRRAQLEDVYKWSTEDM